MLIKSILKKEIKNFNFYLISVYKSNKNFYCQIYSLFNSKIIFGLSNISILLKKYINLNFGKNLNFKIYYFLGKILSFYLIKFKIFKIIFLRNKNKYYGNIKIFANTLRINGIIF